MMEKNINYKIFSTFIFYKLQVLRAFLTINVWKICGDYLCSGQTVENFIL